MWRMVGRPERSDPDEFLYSLFHSSYAEKGYDFIGYVNKEYDALAEKQRTQLDREERRKTVFEMQKIIDRDQPYAFLVHPKYPLAFNKAVFKEDTVVNQTGIGIRNIWTFVGIQPIGAQKDLIINSTEIDQRHQPALYRRRGRQLDHRPDLGPHSCASARTACRSRGRPRASTWADDKTIDIKLRAGMKWHDGKPVTIDDVIFSFTAAGRRQGADVQAVRHRDRRDGEGRRHGPALQAQEAPTPRSPPPRSQDQPDPQAHLGAGAEGPRGQAGERRADQGSQPHRLRPVQDRALGAERGDPARSLPRPLQGAQDRRAGSCASCPTPRRRSAC